jgi:cell division protein FtsW (lipid II flippase)
MSFIIMIVVIIMAWMAEIPWWCSLLLTIGIAFCWLLFAVYIEGNNHQKNPEENDDDDDQTNVRDSRWHWV